MSVESKQEEEGKELKLIHEFTQMTHPKVQRVLLQLKVLDSYEVLTNHFNQIQKKESKLTRQQRDIITITYMYVGYRLQETTGVGQQPIELTSDQLNLINQAEHGIVV